jgi:putative colanic acid biosysnthesis UDP-glucose lipid carrier transferase
MTQINLFRQSFPVIVVASIQALLPALVSAASLWLVAFAYGKPFEDRYVILAVLSAALSMAVINKSARTAASEFRVNSWPDPLGIITRWLLIVFLLATLGYATKLGVEYSRKVVLTWALVNPLLLLIAHVLLQALMKQLLYAPTNVRSVVFAGCNDVSLALAGKLRDYPELCMRASGFFDDRSAERLGIGADVRLLGKLSDLSSFVAAHGTDVIFISLPIRHIKRVLDLLESLRDTTTSIYYVPDIFAVDLIQSRTDEIHGVPVVALCETPFYGSRGVVKRSMDMVIAALMLLVLAPVMLVVAALIKFS